MITSLDDYINKYYLTHLDKISKVKIPNYQYLNFHHLNAEQKLVQITLTIKISDKCIIKDKIDWDLSEEKRSPELFSIYFIDSLASIIKDKELIELNKKNIRNQILEQLIEHLCKINKFPKFHIIKKPDELNGINELCPYCRTIKKNENFCVNCLNPFDKFITNNNNTNINENNNNINPKPHFQKKNKKKEKISQEDLQTERQRILSLRQKSINIEENNLSNQKDDKKICKKCGEINEKKAFICHNCGYKFPIITCFNIYDNNSVYCIHFWDKINKNHIIQQLKDFGNFFNQEDFSSLKFLYERTKEIIKENYEEILTKEAYDELTLYINKMYQLFSIPSSSSQKVFDKTYENKYHKPRPLINMLNYNDLPNEIREGWLPENDVNLKYINKPNIKKVKIYDNITKNKDNEEEEININDNQKENKLKRKRGRPKKQEIFRTMSKNFNNGKEYNEIQIIMSERVNLLKSDIKIEDDLLHYDFCGQCGDVGKLICCETCSSAYHYQCIGYDKFPRGKFKCYFCKVVKLGIENANSVTKEHINLIHKLIQIDIKFDKWYIVAYKLINVLKAHQCSSFFKEPFPKEIEDFYHIVKEPRDLSLIEIKLKHCEYKTLNLFLSDLSLIWKGIKMFYKSNSFFWRSVDSLEVFVNHMVKSEKIFERFDFDKEVSKEEMENDFIEYSKYIKQKEKDEKKINKDNNNFSEKKKGKKMKSLKKIESKKDKNEEKDKKGSENIELNENNEDNNNEKESENKDKQKEKDNESKDEEKDKENNK